MLNLMAYPTRNWLFQELARVIADELKTTLQTRKTALLAVPGGTTPGPLFDALSARALDWSRVCVLPGDERWVPESAPRSNAAQIKSRLLANNAARAGFLPLYAEAPTPEDALPALTETLAPHLPLSVAVLGMGDDMHTASLFPGASGLAAALADDAPPLVAIRAEAAGEPRVSLSARTLRAAAHLHILITGREKRRAIEAAVNLPDLKAPIRTVMQGATIHWAE